MNRILQSSSTTSGGMPFFRPVTSTPPTPHSDPEISTIALADASNRWTSLRCWLCDVHGILIGRQCPVGSASSPETTEEPCGNDMKLSKSFPDSSKYTYSAALLLISSMVWTTLGLLCSVMELHTVAIPSLRSRTASGHNFGCLDGKGVGFIFTTVIAKPSRCTFFVSICHY
ncbi:hypothetical protein BJ508DRAFT_414607 [Ascobolus immersus RN42]|uniref:Uncharacterized protein n=1 Tax=Ascobolus immersus RN42 TaxID=1160509 RepID=A0A3N4I6H9_ASCIM|nr:hypothetical protein BJ508DRAFT_414607 [Ascobolus immersus RN42]